MKMLHNSAMPKLLAAAVCLCLITAFQAYSQRIEKRIEGKSYVIDYDKKCSYNKAFPMKQDFATDGFSVKQNSIVADVLREVLGKKRIETLKADKVIVSFVCRADGSVESVNYRFPTKAYFTVEELKKLEDKFLAIRFPLSIEPGIYRLGFSYHVRFNNL